MAFLFAILTGFLGRAVAAPGIDAALGVWQDYFPDLAGVSYNKQGTLSSPGGFTVSTSPCSWSQPYHDSGDWERFSTPVSPGMQSEPTIQILNSGTTREIITLWSRCYMPFSFFGSYTPTSRCSIMAKCLPGSESDVCGLGMVSKEAQNGQIAANWLTNVPYDEGTLSAAYWGYKTVTGTWISESIDSFHNMPIMYGVAETLLVPGFPYNVAFVTSVNLKPETIAGTDHTGYPVDYMEFRLVDRAHDVVHASLVIQEMDFGAKSYTNVFTGMLPVTFEVNPLPAVAGAVWDFQAVSLVDVGSTPRDRHPTNLGPVFVTGAKGRYESPTLDTLSPQTRWLDLSWDLYETATPYLDSSLPLGSPLSPVQISYQVRTPDSPLVSIPPAAPSADGKIDMTLEANSSTAIQDGSSGQASGRYFNYWLDLYSRSAAGSLDGDLAPMPKTYWGGYRPFVRRITVRYVAAAAMAVSTAIAPPSVRRWRTVEYTVFKPGASTVQVDVLSEAGNVLLSDVKPGSSVESIDPYTHPRLKLRAVLTSDPVDTSLRPVLEHWEMRWEPLPEIVEVRCNSIRPDRGEACAIQIGVPEEGKVRAVVYDVAGQEVRTLLDETMSPQAAIVIWDGRNKSGRVVAAGVYFLNVSVPGARKVKRLAVVR